ncbi:SDR family oxidoreductase [Corynebacterium breve]|uniref:SDR family oxidoreductase n=1 Tax=Corynebacterium breve TaxID=3049799 RepID=A0ABY8VHA6_9CORY|nr:SDR family oxidoreductase [Corynebacterium breve]WIM68331.1 SDR family oxidoreductase [Corynebacterium breve]
MKTALVTGASRGIGRAIAEDLGRDHHVLVGATRDASEVVATLPSAEPFEVDLTDAAALAQAATQIESLDVLVHSAGVCPWETVEGSSLSTWREAFELNVFAVAELTRLLLPALRRTTGLVVAINSGSGFHSGEKAAVYSGTKFALRAFTDALRVEEKGRLRVTSVHPGRVDTDMQVQLQKDMGATGYDGSLYATPESVARAVRLAVDMGEDASVDEISVRPSGLVLGGAVR